MLNSSVRCRRLRILALYWRRSTKRIEFSHGVNGMVLRNMGIGCSWYGMSGRIPWQRIVGHLLRGIRYGGISVIRVGVRGRILAWMVMWPILGVRSGTPIAAVVRPLVGVNHGQSFLLLFSVSMLMLWYIKVYGENARQLGAYERAHRHHKRWAIAILEFGRFHRRLRFITHFSRYSSDEQYNSN